MSIEAAGVFHRPERAAQTASTAEMARSENIAEPEKRAEAAVLEVVSASTSFHIRLPKIARNHRVLKELTSTLEPVHGLEASKPVLASKVMTAHIDNSRRMLRLFGG